MRFNGRNGPVARFAWARAHGPIPTGLIICHKCDNPLCYEVAHLYAGTYHDNMMDCYERGQRTRMHPFDRKPKRLHSSTLAELAYLLSRPH